MQHAVGALRTYVAKVRVTGAFWTKPSHVGREMPFCMCTQRMQW